MTAGLIEYNSIREGVLPPHISDEFPGHGSEHMSIVAALAPGLITFPHPGQIL